MQEDTTGIEGSAAYVEELVAAEVAAGVGAARAARGPERALSPRPDLRPPPPARSRIVVAGFSQGGAVALTVGLRSPTPLAGVVALSTWLPLASSYPAAVGAGAAATPAIMCHGTQDQVVKTEYGVRSAERLKELGQTVEFLTYRMAHSAVPEELSAVAAFLRARLP